MEYKLLISLLFCHYLADYTWLSTAWMLNAKRFGKPLFPIFIHALVHSLLMTLPLFIILGGSNWLYLIVLQLVTHFLIDVWKGRMNEWFPVLQSPANKLHWVIFGFDQTLHILVIILMTYLAS